MASTKTKRARKLGIPFDGTPVPGGNNAITDVPGVTVGQRNTDSENTPTLNTGVTAILPLRNDKKADDPKSNDQHGINTIVPAGWYAINGCGEMTGTHWIEESGFLNGPIMLTNTASVGSVRDAVIQYSRDLQNVANSIDINQDIFGPLLPCVAETYDGWLSDILAFAVDKSMVYGALDDAAASKNQTAVAEGNVGAGTGTTCYDWKGGIGTSSRVVNLYQLYPDGSPVTLPPWPSNAVYNLGVLVQANQGTYWDLVIRGVPVGAYMAPPLPAADTIPSTINPANGRRKPIPLKRARKSSIIVVVATDAPLLPSQLKRLAHRATHGIARTGTNTNDDSGELVIAFSTANLSISIPDQLAFLNMIPNDNLDPFFDAVAQATEEAIINALVMSDTLEVSLPKDPDGNKKHIAKSISDDDVLPNLLKLLNTFNLMNRPANPLKRV